MVAALLVQLGYACDKLGFIAQIFGLVTFLDLKAPSLKANSHFDREVYLSFRHSASSGPTPSSSAAVVPTPAGGMINRSYFESLAPNKKPTNRFDDPDIHLPTVVPDSFDVLHAVHTANGMFVKMDATLGSLHNHYNQRQLGHFWSCLRHPN